ncbi:O-antigen ligase family protein [Noviherbaspirillum malthae]|uniref:O-antigen ligase family protein n=1 Tax=Noviherbaspirillum malthae TaxID=1260987 RepID=UPI00188F4EDB|nr:O-antigen ligase family protein [Noviherbaspirillum malthae]
MNKTVGVLMIVILISSTIPVLISAVDQHIALAFVLPVALVVAFLFAYDKVGLLFAIIVSRAALDIFLEASRTSFGGVGGLLNLFVILIALCVVVEKPFLYEKKITGIWAPFFLTAAVGVMIAPELIDAVRTYLALISNMAVFVVVFYYVRSVEQFQKIVRLVVLSSVLPALFAVYEFLTSASLDGVRLKSTFAHPNIFAFYLNLVITLIFYLLKSSREMIPRVNRTVLYLYMFFLIGLLLLTQTRSAWLACFAFFVLYSLVFERRLLLYVAFVPLIALLLPTVQDRIIDLGTGNELGREVQLNSFAWRVVLWQSALSWIPVDRYIYGFGIGGFRFHAPEFFALATGYHWSAHNVYVEILFDLGIVGLLAYLWMQVKVTAILCGLWDHDRFTTFIALLIVAEYLIVSASDNMLSYLVFNWYFWFVVGGACALACLAKRRTSDDSHFAPMS